MKIKKYHCHKQKHNQLRTLTLIFSDFIDHLLFCLHLICSCPIVFGLNKININLPLKKCNVHTSVCGRSMVEMLGVLAIIGVLSVGAISDYNKAMMKYKLNKQAEQVSSLINAVSRYKNDLKLNDGSTYSVSLIDILKKLNEIPKEMYVQRRDDIVEDVFKNSYSLYHHTTGYIGIMTALNMTNHSIESCKNIYMISKEYHQTISALEIGKYVEGSYIYTSHAWGQNSCSAEKRCLKDLTIADTEELCRVCDQNQSCLLLMIWW